MKHFYAIELRKGLQEDEVEGYIVVIADTEEEVFLFGIVELSTAGFDAPVDFQLMFESAQCAVGLLAVLNERTTWYDDVSLSHKFTSSDDFYMERSFNEDFNLSEFIQAFIVFQPHSEDL